MPTETGRHCAHCTDENGQLPSFDQRIERMTKWQARRYPRTSCEEIESQTLDYMATMPAWREHPVSPRDRAALRTEVSAESADVGGGVGRLADDGGASRADDLDELRGINRARLEVGVPVAA
jgi:hypothetical protein